MEQLYLLLLIAGLNREKVGKTLVTHLINDPTRSSKLLLNQIKTSLHLYVGYRPQEITRYCCYRWQICLSIERLWVRFLLPLDSCQCKKRHVADLINGLWSFNMTLVVLPDHWIIVSMHFKGNVVLTEKWSITVESQSIRSTTCFFITCDLFGCEIWAQSLNEKLPPKFYTILVLSILIGCAKVLKQPVIETMKA